MWFTCPYVRTSNHFSIVSQIEPESHRVYSIPFRFGIFYEFIFKYCVCIGINFKASAVYAIRCVKLNVLSHILICLTIRSQQLHTLIEMATLNTWAVNMEHIILVLKSDSDFIYAWKFCFKNSRQNLIIGHLFSHLTFRLCVLNRCAH